MIDSRLLRTLSVFSDCSSAVVEALAGAGRLMECPADTMLFLEGDEPRGWFVVVEGHVRVVRGHGPRQHVIHTEGPGGTLGEVPLFAGGSYPASAYTSEPTVLAYFATAALRRAMAREPGVALMLLRLLSLRVRRLVDRLDGRSARTVQVRLAQFLLARHEATRRGASISLGMTQQRLAEELGTVREVVSRELLKLRRDGILESAGGGRFRARDVRALQRIAAG